MMDREWLALTALLGIFVLSVIGVIVIVVLAVKRYLVLRRRDDEVAWSSEPPRRPLRTGDTAAAGSFVVIALLTLVVAAQWPVSTSPRPLEDSPIVPTAERDPSVELVVRQLADEMTRLWQEIRRIQRRSPEVGRELESRVATAEGLARQAALRLRGDAETGPEQGGRPASEPAAGPTPSAEPAAPTTTQERESADPGQNGSPPAGEIVKPVVRFPGGRRYVSTTAADVQVDLLGPPDRPATAGAWYGVRLRDVQGLPLHAERVAITWRTDTGALIEVPFDPATESGLYAGRVTLPRGAMTDFRLHVTMRDRRFAIPLNASVLGARSAEP